MKKLAALIGFAVIVACVMFVPQYAVAAVTYEGSSTIGEGLMPEAVKAFEAKSGAKFASVGMLGSGKGFAAVVDGKADIGGLSRALSTAEKNQKVYYKVIGYDAVAIFVNAKNPVKALTKDQVKGIFTGKIKNWKEVGGKDAAISLITEIKAGQRATIEEFKKAALDGAEYATSIEIDKPHACVTAVVDDENAITHASLAFGVSGAKAVLLNNVEASAKNVRSGAYLLSRPLVLVSKGIPKGDVQKFFEFILSPEGQAIVGKNFVTVR